MKSIANSNKTLTVYKASAGSGKTFTLTVEFISILVKYPEDYNKMLAVTFTNKATSEMKLRILSQLYGIGHGLASSKNYLEKVKANTALTEATIRNNALYVLEKLTHEYHNFRVQTIDAFFQAVLRNLGKELGLTANLRVDLNTAQVEAKAVDELIDNLKENDPVLKWIDDYISSNIEEDKNWNVVKDIKEFGKKIFDELYKTHEKQLDSFFKDNNLSAYFIKTLRSERDAYEKNIKEKAEKIVQLIAESGFPTSYFAAYPYKYIVKLSKGQIESGDVYNPIQQIIDGKKQWNSSKCSKKADKDSLNSFVESIALNKIVYDMEAYRIAGWKRYNTCKVVLLHFSKLRLLHKIAKQVEEDNVENHRFMLSNTQSLLKNLMKDNDIPFVFERIGAMLKYIMIDEFQDTSRVQWDNFKKLLLNCMAEAGSHNLLVGDVKQSIYRWRQGDWELLNNIEESIKPSQGSYVDTSSIEVKTLATNYRSEKNIISFNNAFFSKAINVYAQTEDSITDDNSKKTTSSNSKHLSTLQIDKLKLAYSDVEQQSAKSEERGFVHASLYGKDADNNAKILSDMADNIKRLLDMGYAQKSIAILVRSKREIADIVTTINSTPWGRDITIVSEEAFRLDASLAVNILVEALRLMVQPYDNLTRAKLVRAYYKVINNDEDFAKARTHILVSDVVDIPYDENYYEKKADFIAKHLNGFLPEEYVLERDKLLRLSMVDLVDRLYHLFQLHNLPTENAYISTFYDTLNDYLSNNTSDIDDFIKEWDDNLCGVNIQTEDVDGIRILTIHKSKGLEFDNVVIPFCDWELEKWTTIFWVDGKEKEAPFSELPIIPVSFKKDLENSAFASDYKEEHFQNVIDNLNLLYVAFTRAGKNLFISGKNINDSNRRSYMLWHCLEVLGKELKNAEYVEEDKQEQQGGDEPITFSFGTLIPAAEYDKTESQEKTMLNPFTIVPQAKELDIETFNSAVSFRQSNKSDAFIHGQEVSKRQRYMQVGSVLHNIFSSIKTFADIEPHLQALEAEGIIYNDDVSSKELRQQITSAINNEQVKEWFSQEWKVYNECAILQYDKTTDSCFEQRPDRVIMKEGKVVVIDYKFGSPRGEYHEQVQRYMQLLKKMGYCNISGYLWYVMRGEVVEVVSKEN